MTLALPTEELEQVALVHWLDLKGLRYSAIPHSTFSKSWSVKARNKRTGVRPGVPDLVVLLPPSRTKSGVGMCVWVELKRLKGGVVSLEQREWIDALNALSPSVKAFVARGCEDAIKQLEELMGSAA